MFKSVLFRRRECRLETWAHFRSYGQVWVVSVSNKIEKKFIDVYCSRLRSILTSESKCWLTFQNIPQNKTYVKSCNSFYAWRKEVVGCQRRTFSDLTGGSPWVWSTCRCRFIILNITLTVPWLRRLVAGLSQRRPGFDPASVNVGFVVDKVALGQVFSPSTSVLSC
jgi:hypothetical protein